MLTTRSVKTVDLRNTTHAASRGSAEATSLSTGASGDEASSALANGAAGRRALAIVSALAGDELGTSGLAGASSRCSRGSSRCSGRRSGGGGGTTSALTSLGVVDTGGGGGGTESEGGDVVRRNVSEPTASVTLLGDNGSSAFARLEATAEGGAVGVGRAGTGDELRAGRAGGASCRGSRSGRSGGCRGSSSGSTAEATPLASRSSGDELSSALANRAAGGCTLAVIGTFTGDELSSGGLAGAGGRGGRSSSRRRRGRGGGATSSALASLGVVDTSSGLLGAKSEGGNVVGGDVTEAAAAVTLLRYDCRRALARLEAAAGGSAVVVRCARTSDELGAGTRENGGRCHEGN